MSMSKIKYMALCVVSYDESFTEGVEYKVVGEGDTGAGGDVSIIDNAGDARNLVWRGLIWEFERVDRHTFGDKVSSDGGDIITPQPTTIEQLLAKANRHAAKAAKHERKAAEHEAKRVEAVENARQLMPGYTLEISAKWERDLPEEHTEDMTDPANWKVGDVVECITASIGFGGRESFVMGNKYNVSRNYGGALLDLAADEYGEANGLAAKNFRWISRPQGESA
jgi:hypothetical protein